MVLVALAAGTIFLTVIPHEIRDFGSQKIRAFTRREIMLRIMERKKSVQATILSLQNIALFVQRRKVVELFKGYIMQFDF